MHNMLSAHDIELQQHPAVTTNTQETVTVRRLVLTNLVITAVSWSIGEELWHSIWRVGFSVVGRTQLQCTHSWDCIFASISGMLRLIRPV